MKLIGYLRALGERLLGRWGDETELEDELSAHVQLRADDLERAGVARREAERRARIEFGARERIEEECREERAGNWFESWMRDIGFSLRLLRKSPSFTLVAVLTLAVAIGANAVVFAAWNAFVLQSVDAPHPEQLYVLQRSGDNFSYESYPDYRDLRDRNHTFAALVADSFERVGLQAGSSTVDAWAYDVSGNYFAAFGVKPYLGRFFGPSDERGPNSAPYIVLTYDYWQHRFHGDRGVIGRTVGVDHHPFTVLGVTSQEWRGDFPAFAADCFIPIVDQPEIEGTDLLDSSFARRNRWMSEVAGRLKPGVTATQATADLNGIERQLEKEYPGQEDPVTYQLIHPGMGNAFNGAIRAFLGALVLLAGLILVAACANLGSVFAARAADRSREIALRLALGSPRRRILRQLFTEAGLIAVAGGGVGLWASIAILGGLTAWRPFPEFPLNLPVAPDAHVYWMALGLALASAGLFGAVPVRQVLRTHPYAVIKGQAGAGRRRRIRLRDVLLAGQIAVCALLVTASFVAVRGLVRSIHSRLGVEPNQVMLANVSLHKAGYPAAQIPGVQRHLIAAMREIAGVSAVGLVNVPPLHMGWDQTSVFGADAADLRPAHAAASPVIEFETSPGYFQAAGTRLLSGRNFTREDDAQHPAVAIVNPDFARAVFGSPEQALGKYFKTEQGIRTEVVGIAEQGKYTANLAQTPQPAMFLPILQAPASSAWLVIRSRQPTAQLRAAVQQKIRDLDPALPVFVQTWNQEMNGALFAPRIASATLGLLGMMGLLLSLSGIFGMAANAVRNREHELGIRLALGAQPAQLLGAALGSACRLLAFGSVAGLGLGLLAGQVLSSVVYQATPRDPLVLAGAVLAMALVGLLAMWIPAQRALGVSPLELIREQ